MNIRPTRNNLVIKPVEHEEKSEGGIYLVADTGPRFDCGIVMAAGPGLPEVPMTVKVGDMIYYTPKHHGQTWKDYIVISEDEVVLIEVEK